MYSLVLELASLLAAGNDQGYIRHKGMVGSNREVCESMCVSSSTAWMDLQLILSPSVCCVHVHWTCIHVCFSYMYITAIHVNLCIVLKQKLLDKKKGMVRSDREVCECHCVHGSAVNIITSMCVCIVHG